MKLAFVGKMGSGKTTCANYIKSKNSKFYITNFAKKLKEIAREMYGMKEKDRHLLQTVGDAMRGVDPDVFANFVIKECFYRTYCMVDDARFPNELDKLKKNGWKLIKLDLSPESQKSRLELKYGIAAKQHLNNLDHHSETYIDKYDRNKFDYIINTDQPFDEVKKDLDKIMTIYDTSREKIIPSQSAMDKIDEWFLSMGFGRQIQYIGINYIKERYNASDSIIELIRNNWDKCDSSVEEYRRPYLY